MTAITHRTRRDTRRPITRIRPAAALGRPGNSTTQSWTCITSMNYTVRLLSGRRSGWAAGISGLALLAASCVTSSPRGSGSASPMPTRISISPSPSIASEPVLEWHSIDASKTTPLLATAATDTEILWSAGPDAPGNFAPDLYRYSTSSGRTERIVRSNNRRSNLLPVVGSTRGYAYVEGAEDAAGLIHWTLWYLSSADSARPVAIDKMGTRVSPAPTIAIDDKWLAWGSVHDRNGHATSQLNVLDLDSMKVRAIAAAPATNAGYWFPSLDGDRLVYSEIVTNPAPSSQVFLVDLSSDGKAQRLDTNGDAAMASISGEHIVWKRNADNALDWGSLISYSPSSGESVIQLGDEPQVNYPSLGSRFVAAWELESTNFYIYDLETNGATLVEALPADSSEGNVRPYIHGHLMSWVHVLPGDNLELRWASLPE
jgi:hypothetical protein